MTQPEAMLWVAVWQSAITVLLGFLIHNWTSRNSRAIEKLKAELGVEIEKQKAALQHHANRYELLREARKQLKVHVDELFAVQQTMQFSDANYLQATAKCFQQIEEGFLRASGEYESVRECLDPDLRQRGEKIRTTAHTSLYQLKDALDDELDKLSMAMSYGKFSIGAIFGSNQLLGLLNDQLDRLSMQLSGEEVIIKPLPTSYTHVLKSETLERGQKREENRLRRSQQAKIEDGGSKD